VLILILFQMKFAKIIDVTDSDSTMVQSQSERDFNLQLQFDDSEILSMRHHHNNDSDDDMNDEDIDFETEQKQIQHDLALLHPETRQFMGDWKCAEIKVDEITSDALADDDRSEMSPAGSTSSMDSFYKPEADQTSEHDAQLLSDDVVTALQRDSKDYATITRGVEE